MTSTMYCPRCHAGLLPSVGCNCTLLPYSMFQPDRPMRTLNGKLSLVCGAGRLIGGTVIRYARIASESSRKIRWYEV
ncbi:hypothetical protein D3C78_393140 [compost metagenome]